MPPASKQRSRMFTYTYFCHEVTLGVRHASDVLFELFEPGEYGMRQLEKCPSSGKLHWQGFCVFKDAKTITSVIRMGRDALYPYDPTIHWEIAKGNLEQNEKYCSKVETRASPGSPPQ